METGKDMGRRILHVLEWAGIGGIESMVLELAKQQREAVVGFLFNREGPRLDRFRELGVPIEIVSLALRTRDDPFAHLEAFAMQADILHVHSMYLHSSDTALALHLKRPLLVTLHSATTVKAAEFPLVCVSDEIRQSIKSEHRVSVIENGVDCNRFFPPDHDELSGTLVIRVCRPERSAPNFWKIMRQVSEDVPSVRLWLVGEDGTNDERTCYWGFQTDVSWFLRQADIFVYLPNPAEEGAHDVNVLEAMASGLAIVTTRSRGVRQSLSHGFTALLFDPSDDAAISKAIVTLIKDRDLRRHLGQNARAVAEARFSIERVARQYHEEYLVALDHTSGCP